MTANKTAATAEAAPRVDITRAATLTPETAAEVDRCFAYQPWDAGQIMAGEAVRMALALGVKALIENVPPSPDRSSAIRKLREARQDCMSAISFHGRY